MPSAWPAATLDGRLSTMRTLTPALANPWAHISPAGPILKSVSSVGEKTVVPTGADDENVYFGFYGRHVVVAWKGEWM